MKRTALITGASSGIGAAIASELAASGHDLILVARSRDKMEQLAGELGAADGVKVTVLPEDLSDAHAAQRVFDATAEHSLTVDVLVNNAGYGTHGMFAGRDLAEEQDMMMVNMLSLVALTRLFLPGMLERKYGRILNVGSTGSFGPSPLMAVYCATKAFVLSFSEGLSGELVGSGVSVTALCPGITYTGFQQRAGVKDTLLVNIPGGMYAGQVAKIGVRAMMRGRRVVVPGLFNQVLVFLMRITPRWLYLPAAKRSLHIPQ